MLMQTDAHGNRHNLNNVRQQCIEFQVRHHLIKMAGWWVTEWVREPIRCNAAFLSALFPQSSHSSSVFLISVKNKSTEVDLTKMKRKWQQLQTSIWLLITTTTDRLSFCLPYLEEMDTGEHSCPFDRHFWIGLFRGHKVQKSSEEVVVSKQQKGIDKHSGCHAERMTAVVLLLRLRMFS